MDREFHGLIGPLQQFTVRRNGKSRSGKADFKNNDERNQKEKEHPEVGNNDDQAPSSR
jgi:hypothetical protein